MQISIHRRIISIHQYSPRRRHTKRITFSNKPRRTLQISRTTKSRNIRGTHKPSLENNVFEFNEQFYLQTQGTAMGTKMAPAYANLFMGKLEEHLLHLAQKHIHTWKIFIDDIFIIWTGTKSEFEQYMHTINQIHQTIKFTHEISDTELTFLDVTLYKGDRFLSQNILDLRTHIKATNNYTSMRPHITLPQP